MKERIKSILPFVGLALLCVLLSLFTDKFLTTRNLGNVLRRSAPVVIMATGMTFIIVAGGIDLSVGSVLALAGVCGTLAMSKGFPLGLASGIIIALLVGGLCGMANGILSVGLRIPPFIATLGMMSIARGIALMMTKEMPVTENLPDSFAEFGTGSFLGITPWPVAVMVSVVVLGALLMRCTPLGRYAYAIGSNREAAYHSGIPVSRYSIIIYTLAGCLTGLAGIMIMARLDSGQPTEGVGMELTVIAAVVIGGGSLSGGEGNILGAVVGALLMAVLLNGCVLLGISHNVQQLVIGALIIAAVALDQYLRRRGTTE
ncbi:MAG: ABC transporter permease [Planctomycetes bacterium]|nr:ABC transporter permease [Planctomycetota bacterium]